MMRVLYWPRIALARQMIESAIRAIDGVELVVAETIDEVEQHIDSVDGVIMPDAPGDQARRIVAKFSDPGARAKFLHIVTAGREGLDAVGIPPHIAVSGPEGAIAPTVAEHGMGMLLALKRQLPLIIANQAKQTWDRSIVSTLTSIEGGRMLLLGYGAIGRAYAARARGFGMEVIAVTRTPRPDELADVRALDEFETMLPTADVVVLCIALTDRTRGIMDAKALASMKPTAVLINSSRGGMIDTDALVAALRSGQIAGAGVDVTAPEPLPDGHPLWTCPNAIVSPHLAGSGSLASQQRLVDTVVRAIQRHKPA